MERSVQIAFLRAKVKAIAESGVLTPENAAQSIAMHEQAFAAMTHKVRPMPKAEQLDAELEVRLRLAFRDKRQAEAIRTRLKEEFGFCSLAPRAEAVARRALKRGRIGSAKEADTIREFLSEDSADQFLGAEKAAELDGLLAAWERGA